MKVSIITVCFNSEKTLEETIQSVLIQDYPEVENTPPKLPSGFQKKITACMMP